MHRLSPSLLLAVGCAAMGTSIAAADDGSGGSGTGGTGGGAAVVETAPAEVDADPVGFAPAASPAPGEAPSFTQTIPPLRFKQFNLTLENDAITMGNFLRTDDDHYTNGIGLAFGFDGTLAASAAQAIPFYDSLARSSTRPVQSALGITVGQMVFTPDDDFKDVTEEIPGEWPYQGYLFVGIYSQRATETTLDHLQIDFGVTGDGSKAEAVQKGFHDLFGISNFQGWSNIRDTEFAFQFTLRKKWRWRLFEDSERNSALEVIPHAGFTVGTVFRNIEGGVFLRYGWNLPDDFGPGRVLDVQSATGGPGDGDSGIYFFGRVGGRVVEHNGMLEGRTFEVDEETFVGDLGFGIVGYFNPTETSQLELGWGLTLQTDTFKGQKDSDGWGAYFLRYTWKF